MNVFSSRSVFTGMLSLVAVLVIAVLCLSGPHGHTPTIGKWVAFVILSCVGVWVIYMVVGCMLDIMDIGCTGFGDSTRAREFGNIQGGYRIMQERGLSELPPGYQAMEDRYFERYGTLDR